VTTAEGTTQIVYRYPWYTRWHTILFNILAFVMPVYLVGRVLLRAVTENIAPSPVVLLAILFSAVFLSAVLVLTANFYPEISADKNGLCVSFLWYRLPVTWQDIIGIRPSFFNLPNRPTMWVVGTRALTPFHRLYGLLYAFIFHSSFIISIGIENHEDLIQKIEHRRFA